MNKLGKHLQREVQSVEKISMKEMNMLARRVDVSVHASVEDKGIVEAMTVLLDMYPKTHNRH